jgi:hypothetical protein
VGIGLYQSLLFLTIFLDSLYLKEVIMLPYLSYLALFTIFLIASILIVEVIDQWNIKYSDHHRNPYRKRKMIPVKGVLFFIGISVSLIHEPTILLAMIIAIWVARNLVILVTE